MSRRDHGSGSLYQRADGMWVGTLEAGYTATGARRRITVSSKDKRTAAKKLRDKARQLELDGAASLTSARTTVRQWAEAWLDATQRTLRPSPWATNASAVKRWIIPTIGHRRLADLTPADVRAVATAQRKAGLTTSTANRTHSTLTSMLRAAILEGHQVSPRILMVKAPALSVHDRTALPVADAVAVLGAAVELLPHSSRWAAALLQGMRQGEALGLTWDEVDLVNERLTISWQLQRLPYVTPRDRASGFRVPDGYEARQLVGAAHLVRPKTKAGWRVIPIVPWMATALDSWRSLAPESPHGLVWPALDGRPADGKDDLAEWFALQEAAQVGHPSGRWYTGHEARHTTATLLLELGVDPTVVTAILGHSSIITSRGYQHASTKHTRPALEQVAERLGLTG